MRRAPAVLRFLLLALLLAGVVQAAAPEFPALTGRVVDGAGLLSEQDEAELDAALARFEQATTNQIVVATVASLQGMTIEDFGYQLGRHWGIGQAGKDNGALLIVAPEERDVRIEVGYGLEGELTDARSRTIIETGILPRFRDGDLAAGIKAGVAAMIETLGGRYEPALPPARARAAEGPAPSPWPMIVMLPIILIFVLDRFASRRGRRGRRRYGGPVALPGGFAGRRGGDSFGGGGGFSGGGGSFGGGGASGRW